MTEGLAEMRGLRHFALQTPRGATFRGGMMKQSNTLELVYEGGMHVRCEPARASANPERTYAVAYIAPEGTVYEIEASGRASVRGEIRSEADDVALVRYQAQTRAATRRMLGVEVATSQTRAVAW